MTYLAGLARAGADGAEGAYFAALALRGWTLTLAAPVALATSRAIRFATHEPRVRSSAAARRSAPALSSSSSMKLNDLFAILSYILLYHDVRSNTFGGA